MRRRFRLLAFCALSAFAAAPASACFGPYAHQMLAEVPDNLPAGVSVIRVDFTNHGEEFRTWQGRVPAHMGRSHMDRSRRFVGIARRIDRPAEGPFPVYAAVTSCTPDFDVDPSEPLTRQTWLAGRFRQLNGQRVFVALARGADGGWEEVVE